MDVDPKERLYCENVFEESGRQLGLEVVGWRDVPHNSDCLGPVARKSEPNMRQVFMRLSDSSASVDKGGNQVGQGEGELGRKAFILRKWMTNRSVSCKQPYLDS